MAKIALATVSLPPWNSRVTDAEKDKSERASIEDLAASFKSIGQTTPIDVEDMGGGHFLLVSGTRRRAAALMLGWPEIEAIVHTPSDDNTRMIRNIVENVKRKNLTTYEEARACSAMQEKGMKNGEIAAVLGFSMQKASNLASRYKKLPAPILDEWRKQNPAATDDFLAEISSDKEFPTPEKKMQRWDERIAEVAEAEAAGKKAGKRGKGKDKDSGGTSGYPVSQKRLGHVIDALGNAKSSPELATDVRTWARALIAYVIQGRETPPSGIPPLPKKEKKGTE
jgi:ParB/RepB/Spo0J family partition protein